MEDFGTTKVFEAVHMLQEALTVTNAIDSQIDRSQVRSLLHSLRSSADAVKAAGTELVDRKSAYDKRLQELEHERAQEVHNVKQIYEARLQKNEEKFEEVGTSISRYLEQAKKDNERSNARLLDDMSSSMKTEIDAKLDPIIRKVEDLGVASKTLETILQERIKEITPETVSAQIRPMLDSVVSHVTQTVSTSTDSLKQMTEAVTELQRSTFPKLTDAIESLTGAARAVTPASIAKELLPSIQPILPNLTGAMETRIIAGVLDGLRRNNTRHGSPTPLSRRHGGNGDDDSDDDNGGGDRPREGSLGRAARSLFGGASSRHSTSTTRERQQRGQTPHSMERSADLGDIEEEELVNIDTVMQTSQTPLSSTFALPGTGRTDVTRPSSSTPVTQSSSAMVPSKRLASAVTSPIKKLAKKVRRSGGLTWVDEGEGEDGAQYHTLDIDVGPPGRNKTTINKLLPDARRQDIRGVRAQEREKYAGDHNRCTRSIKDGLKASVDQWAGLATRDQPCKRCTKAKDTCFSFIGPTTIQVRYVHDDESTQMIQKNPEGIVGGSHPSMVQMLAQSSGQASSSGEQQGSGEGQQGGRPLSAQTQYLDAQQ